MAKKVKLIDNVSKALKEYAKKKNFVKETMVIDKETNKAVKKEETDIKPLIEKIKSYFQDDLFIYGLNVKIDRASSSVKEPHKKHQKRLEVIDALFNGYWEVQKTAMSEAELKQKAKMEIIEAMEGKVSPELLEIIKKKAGI